MLRAEASVLIAVHLQDRLVPALVDGDGLVDGVVWLARAAQRIGVPVLGFELNPAGLGPTVPALRERLSDDAIATGMRFDCTDIDLAHTTAADRTQVVLAGAEAHVCVLQAALALLERGREVYVVADGVASRRMADRDASLARLRARGVEIVTREMVVFEWLARAGTPLFREVLRDFLRTGTGPP